MYAYFITVYTVGGYDSCHNCNQDISFGHHNLNVLVLREHFSGYQRPLPAKPLYLLEYNAVTVDLGKNKYVLHYVRYCDSHDDCKFD